MEKTRKQLVATVAAMLGDQYKVSISTRHFEESLKEFDSTYFIEIVKKAAGDSLVPVIALDPFVKAVNQNEISMNRAASVIINTFFEAESEADKTDFSSCLLDLCKQIGKDPERAADYELACRIYTCISDNTDCTTEPEAVEALREAVLKSGKAGTSAFELLCDRIEELLENK